jgi:hypothetical protein
MGSNSGRKVSPRQTLTRFQTERYKTPFALRYLAVQRGFSEMKTLLNIPDRNEVLDRLTGVRPDACDAAGDHSNSPSFAEGCRAFVEGEAEPDDSELSDESDSEPEDA